MAPFSVLSETSVIVRQTTPVADDFPLCNSDKSADQRTEFSKLFLVVSLEPGESDP